MISLDQDLLPLFQFLGVTLHTWALFRSSHFRSLAALKIMRRLICLCSNHSQRLQTKLVLAFEELIILFIWVILKIMRHRTGEIVAVLTLIIKDFLVSLLRRLQDCYIASVKVVEIFHFFILWALPVVLNFSGSFGVLNVMLLVVGPAAAADVAKVVSFAFVKVLTNVFTGIIALGALPLGLWLVCLFDNAISLYYSFILFSFICWQLC